MLFAAVDGEAKRLNLVARLAALRSSWFGSQAPTLIEIFGIRNGWMWMAAVYERRMFLTPHANVNSPTTLQAAEPPTPMLDEGDHHSPYLRKALKLAAAARARGDHPFGALLLDPVTGEVVAEGMNSVLTEGDCTGHVRGIGCWVLVASESRRVHNRQFPSLITTGRDQPGPPRVPHAPSGRAPALGPLQQRGA